MTTIYLYFEFPEEKDSLIVRINEKPITLEATLFRDRSMYMAIWEHKENEYVSLDLSSEKQSVKVNIHIIRKLGGKEFIETKTTLVNPTPLKLNIKPNFIRNLSSLTGDKTNRKIGPYKEINIKSRTEKVFDKKLRRQQIEVNDYSYFTEQKKRSELLTKKNEESKNKEVEVFYATNRKKKIKKRNRITYTNSRGDLSLGKCLVNVPGNRGKGQLPLPKWYLIGSSEDLNNYVILRSVEELNPSSFFNEIYKKSDLSPDKDALLFIHGFNVSFTESVARAAQISVDIGFQGAPIIYSWPSRRSLFKYNADEATASGYSTEDIIQLLIQLKKTGIQRVHIIAHSMGNRLLTDALRSFADQNLGEDFLLNQIILAAPDIDAEVFIKYIAPKIVKCSQRVTLYAAKSDIALWFSAGIHGRIQRAGKVTNEIAVSEGIDTIDASKEATDFLGHGYFASNRALIDDISQLTRFNASPSDRNLRIQVSGEHTYWEFW